MIGQSAIGFMKGISPTFLVIGIFAGCMGVFVVGLKFMFWCFYRVFKVDF